MVIQASQLSKEMPPVDSVSGGFQTCRKFNPSITTKTKSHKESHSLENGIFYPINTSKKSTHIASSRIVWHINIRAKLLETGTLKK
jgi:hypothetical protein